MTMTDYLQSDSKELILIGYQLLLQDTTLSPQEKKQTMYKNGFIVEHPEGLWYLTIERCRERYNSGFNVLLDMECWIIGQLEW